MDAAPVAEVEPEAADDTGLVEDKLARKPPKKKVRAPRPKAAPVPDVEPAEGDLAAIPPQFAGLCFPCRYCELAFVKAVYVVCADDADSFVQGTGAPHAGGAPCAGAWLLAAAVSNPCQRKDLPSFTCELCKKVFLSKAGMQYHERLSLCAKARFHTPCFRTITALSRTSAPRPALLQRHPAPSPPVRATMLLTMLFRPGAPSGNPPPSGCIAVFACHTAAQGAGEGGAHRNFH